jgi:undecaprenyl-diphosphatase
MALCVFVVAALSLLVRRRIGFASLDWRVLRAIEHHRTRELMRASRLLAHVGNIETLLVVAVVTAVVLRGRGLRPVLATAPLASLLVAGAFVELMKVTIPRVGPHTYFRGGAQATGSFPSGHAADTTAFVVALAIVVAAVWLRRPAERVATFGAAAAIAGAVGVSRLVLGVHWPTDVLAGWAVGLGTAVVIATLAVIATDRPSFTTTRTREAGAPHAD